MVLIIVITVKIVTEHFGLLPSAASGCLLLVHLCSVFENVLTKKE